MFTLREHSSKQRENALDRAFEGMYTYVLFRPLEQQYLIWFFCFAKASIPEMGEF